MATYPAMILICDHEGCDNAILVAKVHPKPGIAVAGRPLYQPNPENNGWKLAWDAEKRDYTALCEHHADHAESGS